MRMAGIEPASSITTEMVEWRSPIEPHPLKCPQFHFGTALALVRSSAKGRLFERGPHLPLSEVPPSAKSEPPGACDTSPDVLLGFCGKCF